MSPKTKAALGRKADDRATKTAGRTSVASATKTVSTAKSSTDKLAAGKAVATKSATAKAPVATMAKGRIAKPARTAKPAAPSRAAARTSAQPASLKRTSAAQPAARGPRPAAATSARAKAGATRPNTEKAGVEAAAKAASRPAAAPASARGRTLSNPTRQAAATAARPTERKAQMPTKKNVAATTPTDAKTTKSTAPGKPAGVPGKVAPGKVATGKPAVGKSSATRHAAAAFVAARKKMTSAAKPAAAPETVDAVKGVVQVADKSTSKTDDDRVAAAPAAPPAAAEAPPQPPRPMPQRPAALAAKPAKLGGKASSFRTNEFIVYPAHGVGEIIAVESQEVAGYKLELFVISFVKDKMILKVPLPKAASVGMRKLADAVVMKRALDTLTGRARVKRTMWSRRAQEYEAKINSGDLVSIAEVVRDLYRSDAQPEQSYSERQLYEAALDRMARELGAVQKLTDTEALKVIDTQLQKGPRRTKGDEAEAEAEETEEEGGIGEAA